jgi:hypothetical protein
VFKAFAHWANKNKQDESGAVTVDWVVLCASVVGLSLAVLITVITGAKTYATFLSEDIESIAYKSGAGED